MAKLLKVAQNLFASSHGTDEVAQFGSLAASAINYTDDPTLIQSLTQFLEGLFSVTASAAQPPRIEDINALFLLIFRQLKYGFQSGIPEYDPLENYYNESGHISIIQEAGKIYVSQSGTDVSPNVGNNPSTDIGVNWKALTIDTIGPHAITDCNTAWPSLNIVAGTVLFFITSANPANGPGTSTYFGTWTYNSSTSQIQTAIGLDGKKWFRIMTAGTWGTWTSEITSATLGSGWAATLASALGSNWVTALGASLGAGWADSLNQDNAIQANFTSVTGNYLNLFKISGNQFTSGTIEIEIYTTGGTLTTAVFAFNIFGGSGSARLSALSTATLGSSKVSMVISWDSSYNYYFSILLADAGTGNYSARISPLNTLPGTNRISTMGGTLTSAIPGSTGNTQYQISTGVTAAPAPMPNQIYDYGTLSANATLPACNLYETRWAGLYLGVTGYTVYLPATGTYQFVTIIVSTSSVSSSTYYLNESPGGSVALYGTANATVIIMYRRSQ